MSFNWESIGDKIFGILSSAGYGIQMRDENGMATMDPHNAIRFLATIKSQNPQLDTYNVLIGLHDEDAYSHLDFRTPKQVDDADFDTITNLKNSIQKNLGDVEGLKINWTPFGSAITLKDDPIKKVTESIDTEIAELNKKIANMQYNIACGAAGKMIGWYRKRFLALCKQKEELENKRKLAESKDISKVYGTTKSSFQRVGESKLIIRHTDLVDESKQGARWRKIRAVFIETKDGERFKYPQAHVAGARAMARHLSEGGNINDVVGQSISRMSEDYIQLKHANKLLRSSDKSDDSQLVREAMKNLNHNLRRISGPRGYRGVDVMLAKHEEHDIQAASNKSKQFLSDCQCADDNDSRALNTAARYIVKIQVVGQQEPNKIPEWLGPMLQSLATKVNDREHLDRINNMSNDITSGNVPQMDDIRWATNIAKEMNQPRIEPEINRIKQLSGI